MIQSLKKKTRLLKQMILTNKSTLPSSNNKMKMPQKFLGVIKIIQKCNKNHYSQKYHSYLIEKTSRL